MELARKAAIVVLFRSETIAMIQKFGQTGQHGRWELVFSVVRVMDMNPGSWPVWMNSAQISSTRAATRGAPRWLT